MSEPQPVTVATICREPLSVLTRFAAWHRRLGAGTVRMYFDDPADPAIEVLSRFDWILCQPCDTAFWSSVGLTPDVPFQFRQGAAMLHAYHATSHGWVAVLDADELLYFGQRHFADVLTDLPPSIKGVRIRTAEHLVTKPGFEDGQLHFRLPMTKPQVTEVYQSAAPFLRPTLGLVGHNVGKSITRAGMKLRRMRPHWAVGRQRRDLTDLMLGPDADAGLLHFISPDYDGWRQKLIRRMQVPGGVSPRIKAEVSRILATDNPETGLRAFYMALYQADAPLLGRLQATGKHLALRDTLAQVQKELLGFSESEIESPTRPAVALTLF